MHLLIAFDGIEPREINVTDVTTVRLDDGITGELLDLFSLDGVRALYLVRDDGSPVLTGDGPAEQAGVTPEELARSIGWFPPDEKLHLSERVAQLEEQVAAKQRSIDAMEASQRQQEQQQAASRGLFGRRS